MSLLIVALPLLSSFVSGFLGRFIGRKGSVIVTVTLMSLTFILSLFLFCFLKSQDSRLTSVHSGSPEN